MATDHATVDLHDPASVRRNEPFDQFIGKAGRIVVEVGHVAAGIGDGTTVRLSFATTPVQTMPQHKSPHRQLLSCGRVRDARLVVALHDVPRLAGELQPATRVSGTCPAHTRACEIRLHCCAGTSQALKGHSCLATYGT